MSHAVIHPTTDALPWPERPRPRLDAARLQSVPPVAAADPALPLPAPGAPAPAEPAPGSAPARAAAAVAAGHTTGATEGRRPLGPRTVLSLHGSDEQTGRPVTWHVTSLAEDGAPDTYLLERVDGDIHNPAVWMQAQRAAATVGEDDVIALVRRVVFGPSA
ncbi:MAG: hypothetical protein JWP95_1400 [Actinotalea sp.]|nr:hypothetical protein [Actinotalea sp.]